MARFELSPTPFDTATLRARLLDARVGAYASFEGWVRDHNDGRSVHGLRYESYDVLAQREGEAIIEEALARFDILRPPAGGIAQRGEVQHGGPFAHAGLSAPRRRHAFRHAWKAVSRARS